MGYFNDPAALKLVFAAVAGLAVLYFFVHRLLVAWRLRRLGLKIGFHRYALSPTTHFETDLRAPKRTGAWTLSVHVRSMRERHFSLPLPLPEGQAWLALGAETHAFALRAFELGMDRLEQKGYLLTLRSSSFRPLRFGHPGFAKLLATSLEQIDWKLSCVEEQMSVEELPIPTSVAAHWTALVAAGVTIALAYGEPVINQHRTLLEGSEVIWAAMTLTMAVGLMRFWTLRTRFRHLRRKPPMLGDALWNGLAVGMLSCFPIQHLNIFLDSSAAREVNVKVEDRRGPSGLGTAYLVKVASLDGKEAWRLEVEADTYKAIMPGQTAFRIRLHPGLFGMEWVDRVRIEEADRATAGAGAFTIPTWNPKAPPQVGPPAPTGR